MIATTIRKSFFQQRPVQYACRNFSVIPAVAVPTTEVIAPQQLGIVLTPISIVESTACSLYGYHHGCALPQSNSR